METKIFYFSTTGNSLVMARELSRGLNGAELVSIPKTMGQPIMVSADKVGFVFPVYAWGLPSIVVDFIKELKFKGKPYVFAVATCGGTPGRTLLELRGLLRKAGVSLHAGFVCKEGANMVSEGPGFIHTIRRLNHIQYASGKERLPEVLTAIQENRKHTLETSSFACNLACGLIHAMMKLAGDKLKSYDNSYRVDDRCTGCRTCERVCPRANIKMEAGKPAWQHDCGMCNGCIQWCPQHAIHIDNETCRYRNPSVRAEDLMLR